VGDSRVSRMGRRNCYGDVQQVSYSPMNRDALAAPSLVRRLFSATRWTKPGRPKGLRRKPGRWRTPLVLASSASVSTWFARGPGGGAGRRRGSVYSSAILARRAEVVQRADHGQPLSRCRSSPSTRVEQTWGCLVAPSSRRGGSGYVEQAGPLACWAHGRANNQTAWRSGPRTASERGGRRIRRGVEQPGQRRAQMLLRSRGGDVSKPGR